MVLQLWTGLIIVVGDKKEKIKGNKADIILVAYNSIQAALRMMTKEKTHNQITDAISKICTDYKVNPIEGVLSHRMKRDIINVIIYSLIGRIYKKNIWDLYYIKFPILFGLIILISPICFLQI